MEGNYLTAGDLALIENRRGWNYGPYGDGCGHGYGHYRSGNGMGATAIGLGAAGLAVALVVGWGVNQASKARAKAAEQQANLLSNNMNQLAQLQIAENQNRQKAIADERVSRETWQNYHAPSTTQYVDVRTGAGAFAGAGSNAWAQAEAQILGNVLSGRTQMCPQEVTLVAKQNCGCPATNGCGGYNG